MKKKIMTLQTLPDILQHRQRKGECVVFTNGCFDLLHIGHIRYLQAARALGDLLVVAVNSDDSVRSLAKGPGRPLTPVAQRMEVLAALSCVDYVLPFDDPTPLRIIECLQPDVLVKGGDWSVEQIVGKNVVEERGGTVQNIPLIPDVSTTSIIERIQQMNMNSHKSQTTERRPASVTPSLPDPTRTS